MKIALMSHIASERAPTGAEHSLALLARGLRSQDHQVAVTAPGRWGLAAGLRAVGVDVAPIPVRACWLVQHDQQPKWLQGLRLLRYQMPDRGASRLRQWLAEIRPDVVHVNCLPHVRGAKAACSCGLPVVWHLREILPPCARRRWFAGQLRRYATRIVAVSDAVAGWLREEGLGDLAEVVHNGVDSPVELPDRWDARRRFDVPDDSVVIGLFSQLVEHKGALDFVRAARQAAAADRTLFFLIAGRGPESFVRRLRGAAAVGAGADRIRVVPPQDEIWSLLAAVDAAAITTIWPDPLPRVVMEAMAVGKPVIGYTGGGVPEMVVDGETGYLCAPGDIDGLVAAILRIAGNEGSRLLLGEAGRERARALFTVDRHVRRMESILTEVAATQPRRAES